MEDGLTAPVIILQDDCISLNQSQSSWSTKSPDAEFIKMTKLLQKKR